MQALCTLLAMAYRDAPDFDLEAERAWHSLAHWSDNDAAQLRTAYAVTVVDEDMSYPTAREMFADLARGQFRVSRANCTHPLWTVEQNINFRICHDILGHYAAHNAGETADFSWEGELNAAKYHEKTLPRADRSRDALCTELLGQAAHFLVFGVFLHNKIAFL